MFNFFNFATRFSISYCVFEAPFDTFCEDSAIKIKISVFTPFLLFVLSLERFSCLIWLDKSCRKTPSSLLSADRDSLISSPQMRCRMSEKKENVTEVGYVSRLAKPLRSAHHRKGRFCYWLSNDASKSSATYFLDLFVLYAHVVYITGGLSKIKVQKSWGRLFLKRRTVMNIEIDFPWLD